MYHNLPSSRIHKADDYLPIVDGVPMAIEIPEDDRVLPAPHIYEFYNDLRERVFYLDVEVDTPIAMEIHRWITIWNREDVDIPVEERKPIKLLIFSPGGDVDAMNVIIDSIIISKTPVHTYNLGMAYSAGLYILLAGHKRFCLPRSQALIHLGSSDFSGTSTQVVDSVESLKKTMAAFGEWVIERTNIPKATYNRKKKNEWYLDAKEQVEYGVVDGIVNDITELL